MDGKRWIDFGKIWQMAGYGTLVSLLVLMGRDPYYYCVLTTPQVIQPMEEQLWNLSCHWVKIVWLIAVVTQGLYSLSGKTSYRKISWSLEAARFGFKLFQSLWNLAGTSAALLPRCLSNFRAIRPLQHPISRLRDFTRFGGKTSYRLVNRGPGPW